MSPKTDLEKALTYAVVADEAIEISPQLEGDLKISQYQKLLDRVDSPEKVGELLIKLEDDQPYLQLCSDDTIKGYFARWKIPICSRADLDLFSQTLAERVNTLAESNPRVESQVKQRAYLKQLRELPAALSKLEETVSGYDVLNEPVAAVLRYVWEAVTKYGFKMEEEGQNAIEKYDGNISIKTFNKAVHIEIKNHYDTLEFYICQKIKLIVNQSLKKRKFWFDKKEETVTNVPEYATLLVLPLHLFGRDRNNDERIWIGNYCSRPVGHYTNGIFFCLNTEEKVTKLELNKFAELMVKESLGDPERNIPRLGSHLKILLDLPTIMHNHTQRITQNMKDILESSLIMVAEEKEEALVIAK